MSELKSQLFRSKPSLKAPKKLLPNTLSKEEFFESESEIQSLRQLVKNNVNIQKQKFEFSNTNSQSQTQANSQTNKNQKNMADNEANNVIGTIGSKTVATKTNLKKFKENAKNFIDNLSDQELIRFIQDLNKAYHINGESLVSDQLYDYVKDELAKRRPNHPLLSQIGVASGKNKVPLPVYMGSMDKIKGDNDVVLARWKEKYKWSYIVSDKLDGISALLVIEPKTKTTVLYTRGKGTMGQDISHLIPFIKSIREPLKKMNYEPYSNKHKIMVRGELIMTKNKFETVLPRLLASEKGNGKDKVKNVRNVVSGVINSERPDLGIAKYIDFIAYELVSETMAQNPDENLKMLSDSGFHVVDYKVLNSAKLTNEELSKILVKRRAESPFDIDGIIVQHNEPYELIKSGNPKNAFAFKSIATMQSAEVVVLEVKWNMTKDILQPVVVFEPVNIGGVMVQRATGFNGKFIKDNKIGVGTRLLIVRRGDVIPHIEKVLSESNSGEPAMPDTAGYPYEFAKGGVEVKLATGANAKSSRNPEITREIQLKELETFVSRIKFDGVSSGMVEKLFNGGIKTVKDFVYVKKEDLLKIDGIKERMADKIDTSIGRRMNQVDSITLMSASNKLGRGFSVKKIQLIIDEYPHLLKPVDETEFPSTEDLIKIKGIERATATQFRENLPDYYEFVKENDLERFLESSNPKAKDNATSNVKINPKFLGISVVFTKVRDHDLEAQIEASGGKVGSAVSGKTTAVIVPDYDTTSSKTTKAEELDIPVLTLEDFLEEYSN